MKLPLDQLKNAMEHGTPMSPAAISQFVAMKVAIDELRLHVEGTYGLFHDAAAGWLELSKKFQSLVDQNRKRGMTREQALNSRLIHGKGDPNKGGGFHCMLLPWEIVSKCALRTVQTSNFLEICR